MKIDLILLLVLFSVICFGDSVDQEKCERIGKDEIDGKVYLTCYINEITEIAVADKVIYPRNDDMTAFYLWYNKKILYLPIEMDQTFPNLERYNAGYCALTTISKDNFKGLSKLNYLALQGNKIEKIQSDTFEDLVSLDGLHLDKNRIRFLNAEAFVKLINLRIVDLTSNVCISKIFSPSDRDDGTVTEIPEALEGKCDYDEHPTKCTEEIDKKFLELSVIVTETSETISNQTTNYYQKVDKNIEILMTKVLNDLAKMTEENSELKEKLSKLKLETSLKDQENKNLKEKLQEKDDEISRKSEKIIKMKEIIKICSEPCSGDQNRDHE